MMKYKIYKLCLTGILAGTLFSCDDYLDIQPKGNEVLTTVEQYSLLFNAETMHMYTPTGVQFLGDEAWASPAIITQSANVNNTVFTYKDPAEYQRVGNGYYMNIGFYVNSYDCINKCCNVTIDYIGDATGDANLRTQTLAEAHALRAYRYFFLVNMYARHYDPATAATEICVPMWTHFDLENIPQQGTVAQIYQLIEDDLAKAIPHLSNTPANNYHFSKAAGYALKAKVHLFKKEFDLAEAAALESYKLNHQVFDLTNYTGLTTALANQNPEYLYFAFASSVTGTDWSAANPSLAALFDTINDVRYTGFMSYNTTKMGNPNATNEASRGDSRYIPCFDNTITIAKNYTYNYTGLRTTDVMLILAECRARKNDFSEETGMRKYLNEVRKNRIKGYTTTAAPADWTAAVDTVITERRKELLGWFHRIFDLKRLNTEPEFRRDLVRTAPLNPNLPGNPQQTYTLPPDSWLYVIPLPDPEFALYPELKLNVPY